MHIPARLGILVDQRSTHIHLLLLRDIGNGNGDVACAVAAAVIHTSAIALHIFGLVEYHLGIVFDVAFTATDVNHRTVRILLESHDVGEVTP